MSVAIQKLEIALRNGFPDAKFKLIDTAGDEDHYELNISSPTLEALPKVHQHRMIYDIIKREIGELPHALSINIVKYYKE